MFSCRPLRQDVVPWAPEFLRDDAVLGVSSPGVNGILAASGWTKCIRLGYKITKKRELIDGILMIYVDGIWWDIYIIIIYILIIYMYILTLQDEHILLYMGNTKNPDLWWLKHFFLHHPSNTWWYSIGKGWIWMIYGGVWRLGEALVTFMWDSPNDELSKHQSWPIYRWFTVYLWIVDY